MEINKEDTKITKTVHIGFRCKICKAPLKDGDAYWIVPNDYTAGLTCVQDINKGE